MLIYDLGDLAIRVAGDILLGGAPRGLAIANATLAAAIGLGLRLWIAGVVIFALGHAVSVWAARRDPQFVDVARRHLRFPTYLRV
ncbi:conjugal transfer protein [Sphingorhabdus sp.]|uniref:conjugal transfer protein n=1 Tax=Sphingorhabdus sp. TaxID=1902408 RepID=UPI0035B09BDB